MKKQSENLNAAQSLIRNLATNGRFSDELNKRIENRGVMIVPASHFVTTDVSSQGGIFKILDEQNEKIDGESTISKDRFPKNHGFLFAKLGVAYGTGDATKKGSIAYNKAFPAALENAMLEIKQRGNTIVERPIADFNVQGTNTQLSEKTLDLELPNVLRDDEPMEFNIRFPKGVSMPAETDAQTQHVVKVFAYGYATAAK